MLIPLTTDRARSSFPLITIVVIGLNVVIHAVMMAMEQASPHQHEATLRALHIIGGPAFRPWQLVTATFLHADLLHLAGNMLFLWVFGQLIEDRFGRLWFALFYLAAACASSGLHALLATNPAIGASGAVAGVTGSFLVLAPRTRIRTLVFFLIIGVFNVPAWWFIGLGISWDLVQTLLPGERRIATLAHLGGYAFGMVTAFTLLATRLLAREPYDLFSIVRQAKRRADIRAAHSIAASRGPRASTPASGRRPRPAAAGDPTDAIAAARTRIHEFVSQGRLHEAADEWPKLRELCGSQRNRALLGRNSHNTLAAAMYASGRHALAAELIELFIAGYPRDHELPVMKLLLARLYREHAGRTAEAEAILRELALVRGDDDLEQMVRAEAAALGLGDLTPGSQGSTEESRA